MGHALARHQEKRRAYNKAYYEIHREEILVKNMANREKINARQRAYHASHREAVKIRCRERNHGMTEKGYQTLLDKQGGFCVICRRLNSKGNNLVVDHNHTTRQIRGLLCHRCNRGIGIFRDSPTILRLAAEYVESPNKKDQYKIPLIRENKILKSKTKK